jgi:outer membrane protein assembly factor BamB
MLEYLVFVGFNSRVAALHRDTGELHWQWKSPKGSGYTTLLLDGDRLFVSVEGYTYGLDPLTGEQLWYNGLPGFGTGVASLASVAGSVQNIAAAAAEEEERRRSSDSTTASVHSG